jgi:chaperonin GroES
MHLDIVQPDINHQQRSAYNREDYTLLRKSEDLVAGNRKTKRQSLDYVEPIGFRVLVRKDEPKRETKGGIALPDAAEIPTITGRIVTISRAIEHDDDVPLKQYDKVLFHPKNAVPVDFESDNQLFVVPAEDIVAVFRKEGPKEDH